MTRRQFISVSSLGAMQAVARPIRSSLGGRVVGERLPAGLYDAEVEYLESTGTQWIDTGYPMADIRELQMKLNWGAHSTSWREIMGGAPSGSYLIEVGTAGYYGLASNNYSPYQVGNDDVLSWLFEVGTKPRLYVNGNLGCTDALVRIPAGTFKTGGIVVATRNPKCRFFWIQIWTNDGILVRDFQPVRFTNELGKTEGAMYDRISGKLFSNQGTGSFIIGPDI